MSDYAPVQPTAFDPLVQQAKDTEPFDPLVQQAKDTERLSNKGYLIGIAAFLGAVFLTLLVFAVIQPNGPSYKLLLGRVAIFSLNDGRISRGVDDIYFQYITEDMWNFVLDPLGRSYVDSNGQFTADWQYGGYLIDTGQVLVLMDNALGEVDPLFESDYTTKGLVANLEELGFKTRDVDFVVHSHLHRDHTGWNMGGSLDSYHVEFPNAQHIIQQAEYDYFTSDPELLEMSNWDVMVQPLIDRGQLMVINETLTLDSGVSVFLCPGHTPGHQCMHVQSKGESLWLVGDSFHIPAQFQFPSWYNQLDVSPADSIANRQWLLNSLCNDDVDNITDFVAAAHLPYPGIGIVQSSPYQWDESGCIFMPLL